jgi:hypothetical protein
MRLRTSVGETDPAVIGLTGTYHNLLRSGPTSRRAPLLSYPPPRKDDA